MKNPSEINKKLMEIYTHIIIGDYDCLEETIEIAGINPKQGKYLMKNILNKVKQNLLIIQLSLYGCEIYMQIINTPERAIPFHHLLPTDNKEVHLQRGVYFCPNLLLRNLEERKELLGNTNICR